jgi:2,5-diamino-6-(ribosylamino)-4(3H)-pyrimidinone 5'-phosphate reductase
MSLDGKITSGESDTDSDRDWRRSGVKEGLQYYQIEQTIAINSLNTGRVMEKIGLNARAEIPEKDERLTFFIVDRKPHLNENGLRYLAQRVGKLYIVTDNPAHPAFAARSGYDNLEIIFYPQEIDLADLLVKVRQTYGIEHLVIESGGTLNASFVRQGLIDHVVVIVAPLLVGGGVTSSLVDGRSLQHEDELIELKAMKLTRCEVLEHSYLRLEYDVINETNIDPKIYPEAVSWVE